jgi:5-methylcytosine-specific restriction protein A
MSVNDANYLTRIISEGIGLPVDVLQGRHVDEDVWETAPRDLPAAIGFRVRANQGWVRSRAEFVPGRFARDLIISMSQTSTDDRLAFASLSSVLIARGFAIVLVIDKVSFAPDASESWPATWTAFELSVAGPLREPLDDKSVVIESVASVTQAVLALVLCLAADSKEHTEETHGFPEGAVSVIEVNKYERDPRNRAACIAAHGAICNVCHFDFFQQYGEIGADFIHIHHLVPLAVLRMQYIIDPVRDLVPVCPNCHAMLHRRSPPLSPAELSTHMSLATAHMVRVETEPNQPILNPQRVRSQRAVLDTDEPLLVMDERDISGSNDRQWEIEQLTIREERLRSNERLLRQQLRETQGHLELLQESLTPPSGAPAAPLWVQGALWRALVRAQTVFAELVKVEDRLEHYAGHLSTLNYFVEQCLQYSDSLSQRGLVLRRLVEDEETLSQLLVHHVEVENLVKLVKAAAAAESEVVFAIAQHENAPLRIIRRG